MLKKLIKCAVGTAAAVGMVSLAGGYAAYKMALTRQKKKPQIQAPDPKYALRVEASEKGMEYLFSLNPEEVELKSFDGLTLRGYYIPATEPSNKLALLSHGYNNHGPGEFGSFVQFYHEVLGWNVLLIDHRAHGRSEGKRIGFSALEWRDVFDWINAFKGRVEGEPLVALHGISMGAAIVLNCNAHNPPDCVKCVVEDCGYTNGYEMMRLAGRRDLKIKFEPIYWAYAMWYRLFNGVSLRKDADPFGNIGSFKLPTLFIHGAADGFVPTEMGHRYYGAAEVEKDCLFVPDAGHAMAYVLGKEEYEAKLCQWYNKYM